ncbi:hypothetical protein R3P38DRAFT_3476397 [Favolaschia claudopus]|uniref:GATA-type domain-containing protein n=1 Tax=Favolaschia claudopus TaxID=2862362 RepID=A0AAV9ZAI8_9AGAR
MSTSSFAAPSSTSLFNPTSLSATGFDKDSNSASLATAAPSATFVLEQMHAIIPHPENSGVDDYGCNFNLDYAHNPSPIVPATEEASLPANPCPSFDDFLFNEYGIWNMSMATPTLDLDALLIRSNEWDNSTHPQMSPTTHVGVVGRNGGGANTQHQVDSGSGSVDSSMLSNPPINTPTSRPTDARHSQFCERLIRMMREEEIDPQIILTFMRQKIAAAPARLPSRRHRAIPRNARVCSECGTQDTKQWRHHPTTGVVLCNACGQRANRARMSISLVSMLCFGANVPPLFILDPCAVLILTPKSRRLFVYHGLSSVGLNQA